MTESINRQTATFGQIIDQMFAEFEMNAKSNGTPMDATHAKQDFKQWVADIQNPQSESFDANAQFLLQLSLRMYHAGSNDAMQHVSARGWRRKRRAM